LRLRGAGLWVDGHILMESTRGHDLWGVVGGGVEAGESADQACEREFREEVGVDVRCQRLAIVADIVIGLGDTLRMALMGNRERVSADTALRLGLVTEVVPRDALWGRAHELARVIASFPAVATQGTVRAIWESLDKPYRAAMDQGLMYTRLGNPVGLAEIQERGVDRTPPTIR